jgi:hypothetical protein
MNAQKPAFSSLNGSGIGTGLTLLMASLVLLSACNSGTPASGGSSDTSAQNSGTAPAGPADCAQSVASWAKQLNESDRDALRSSCATANNCYARLSEALRNSKIKLSAQSLLDAREAIEQSI